MRYSFVAAAVLALAAGPAMAQPAPAPSVEHQRAAFAAADTNRDGVIDEAEFAADVITAFVAHDADLDEVVIITDLPVELRGHAARVDVDVDGRLSFEEVRAFKLRQFELLDANGDLLLELEEIVIEGPAP
ncbi:MAG: hypothetical protein AB7I59_00715 [Geminicoccaceae bacterium]